MIPPQVERVGAAVKPPALAEMDVRVDEARDDPHAVQALVHVRLGQLELAGGADGFDAIAPDDDHRTLDRLAPRSVHHGSPTEYADDFVGRLGRIGRRRAGGEQRGRDE
jgi:hypothetical protein